MKKFIITLSAVAALSSVPAMVDSQESIRSALQTEIVQFLSHCGKHQDAVLSLSMKSLLNCLAKKLLLHVNHGMTQLSQTTTTKASNHHGVSHSMVVGLVNRTGVRHSYHRCGDRREFIASASGLKFC